MPIALLTLLLAATPAAEPVDTLVVCAAEFRQALEPWLIYRRGQGHRLAVVSSVETAQALRQEVRQRAGAGLRYVVLVGDADPAAPGARTVPTQYRAAVVNLLFGSEPELATDNWFVDLNDDRTPDLAIGRLTADSPAELSTMIAKIIAYETSQDFGAWRRQVDFVAYLGGFGALADALIEAAAKSLIGEGIPPQYATTMTYGSWLSPYCPDPRQFARVAQRRLNEGNLFWIYMGHGNVRELDRVHLPDQSISILDCPSAARLSASHGPTIACLLACYAGAFDQREDCLGEELLRNPRGPVAVLCGTRVMMPYGLAVLGRELLDVTFRNQPKTVGDLVLAAKRQTIEPAHGTQRVALDALAKAISPGGSLEEERREHLDLVVLLGDPLTQISFPEPLEVKAPAAATAGGRMLVKSEVPKAGQCTVELVVRRDRFTFSPPARKAPDPDSFAGYDRTYQKANDPRLTQKRLAVRPGRLEVELDIPSQASGACHVRLLLESADGCYAGAANIEIQQPEPSGQGLGR